MPIAIGFKLLSLFGLSDKLAKKFAPLALAGIVVVLIGLAVLAFNLWLSGEKDEAVVNDRAKSTADALGKARTADEAANTASQDTSDSIEAENRAAAEAAAESDDPLKAGLDELREGR
jgi:xanthosine utilization system XapX-like protein